MTKVQKKPLLKENEFIVEKVMDLHFFDLTGEKSKTRGTSCKSYFLEINLSKTDQRAQIYSMWGPTGGTQTKDWRYYDSHAAAKKDFDKIIKSKKRKGYKEIDVAQRVYGSDEAKSIIKPVILTNTPDAKDPKQQSTLHPKVQYLMGELFGKTSTWVAQTLKCPLGQLTNAQIAKGRNLLSEAKNIVSKKQKSKVDNTKIQDITNDFYAVIPHNLGTGSRGKMIHLLLDDKLKIAQKESDLDTLLDAKSVGAVLKDGSLVDDQYKTLNADISYIEKDDYRFNWINDLVQKTRAHNHRYLGKIILLNIWDLTRHGKELNFLETAENIAKKCRGQILPDKYRGLNIEDRKDIKYNELFKRANILPLFHGTRTENLIGITKQGLLIRPHNAVLTGAMYGSALYTSNSSSKSINYTNIRSSYWASGRDDKAYLFITDTILGNQLIARGAHQYTSNSIKPNHSVWAKSGQSGVINDEMMVYDTNQIRLKYLIEFTCE